MTNRFKIKRELEFNHFPHTDDIVKDQMGVDVDLKRKTYRTNKHHNANFKIWEILILFDHDLNWLYVCIYETSCGEQNY